MIILQFSKQAPKPIEREQTLIDEVALMVDLNEEELS
jgi:hypothetical protein